MDPLMLMPLDKCGRVVIPSHIRRTLKFQVGDQLAVSLSTDGKGVTIQRYKKTCIFCHLVTKDPVEFDGQVVCKKCAGRLMLTVGDDIFKYL